MIAVFVELVVDEDAAVPTYMKKKKCYMLTSAHVCSRMLTYADEDAAVQLIHICSFY